MLGLYRGGLQMIECINNKNKNILNRNKIRIDIKIKDGINVTNEDLRNLLLNCENEIPKYKTKYFIEGDTNRQVFNNFIISEEIRKIFIEIDKHNLPITQFIKWLIQKDYITNNPKKIEVKKETKKREYDFTDEKERYITTDDLKTEVSTSNCYYSFINQIDIENTFTEIMNDTNSILEEIKNTILKDCDTYTIYGSYTITKEKLQIRQDNYTSYNLNEILMMYRKILLIVDDKLRYKIIKNFRELMYIKAMTIYQEEKNNPHFKSMILNDLLYIPKVRSYYHFIDIDEDIYNTIYPDLKEEIKENIRLINHCMNIEYFKDDNISVYDIYNFTYISDMIIENKGDEILDIPVPLPKNQENKKTKFQSGYVAKNKQNKSYFLGDEILDKKDIVSHKLKRDYKTVKNIMCKLNDNRVLNIYADSETEYTLTNNDKEISRELFIKLFDEMVNDIKNKSPKEIEKLNNKKSYSGDKSPIQELLKYDLLLKTNLVTLQCYFENINYDDSRNHIVIFVRNDKKEYYGKNTLNHTYEQKLNYYLHKTSDKQISIPEYQKLSDNEKENYTNIDYHTVIAKIIYTDDIMQSFFDYATNWYYNNIDYTSNTQPLLTVWFHNLKFDILSTGILENFENYNLQLNHFNNQIPRFFDFDINEEIELKSTCKKPKIFFIDSFNFSPTNLATMGETIGIKKPKELVDFNLNTNLIVNEDCLIYSTMDVVILKGFINKFKSYILDYACLKYGAAGTAQNVYLSAFYGDTKYINGDNIYSNIGLSVKAIKAVTNFKDIDKYIDGNYDYAFIQEYIKTLPDEKQKTIERKINLYNKIFTKVDTRIHLHRNPYIESLEMGAYFGGRTEVFNFTGLARYIKSIDINSSYPSSMLNYLPTKYKYTIYNPTSKQLKAVLTDNNLYGLFKVYIKDDSNRIIPLFNDNKVINPCIKDLNVLVHEPEFKLLYEKNKDIKISELHVYKATNLLFSDYINKWSFEKSYNKQEFIKNEVLVSISKLLMNSTYGKFGEKMRVSKCYKMNEEQLNFFSMLISCSKNELITPDMLSQCIYNFDLASSKDLPHDIDYSIKNYFKIGHKPSLELYDSLFYNDIIKDITRHLDDENIRLSFFGGYLSYSKKIHVPSKNSTFILVGAITSYSRSALYKGIDKLGLTNVFYGDTDSLYYNSAIDNIFKNVKLDNIILDNPDNYRKTIEEVNNLVKNYPDKIPLVKTLISQLHFWEDEYKSPYDILIRGNKDNIKIHYISIDEVFIIGKTGLLDDFINNTYMYHKETHVKIHMNDVNRLSKDEQKEYTNYKYCINECNIINFKKSIKNKKYYYCKLSEKHKGVSLKALLLNQDLYLIEDWLSISTQRNKFGSLNGQYITYKLKSLYNSRNDYQKSETISSKNKSVTFIVVNELQDKYKNNIKNKYILDFELSYKYTEQQLKPLEITYDKKYQMKLIETKNIEKIS